MLKHPLSAFSTQDILDQFKIVNVQNGLTRTVTRLNNKPSMQVGMDFFLFGISANVKSMAYFS